MKTFLRFEILMMKNLKLVTQISQSQMRGSIIQGNAVLLGQFIVTCLLAWASRAYLIFTAIVAHRVSPVFAISAIGNTYGTACALVRLENARPGKVGNQIQGI